MPLLKLSLRRRWILPLTGFAIATAMTVLFPLQHFLADRFTERVVRRAGANPPPAPPWIERQIAELPNWYAWLLLSFLIYWFSSHFPLTGPRRFRHLLMHVALAVTLTLLLTVLLIALNPPSLPWPMRFTDLVLLVYLRYVGTFLLIYAGIVGVHHALLYYRTAEQRTRHASELQARLANAQLDVLKMQIHPHFLFNALNTIASLMLSDVRGAQTMIVRLSELLRTSLEGLASHEVPLDEELRILGHYLAIQQVRFQDRLAVGLDIEADARTVLVPRLFLQPLVENAIRHGIERRGSGGRIDVAAALVDGRLRVRVCDDGVGIETGSPARGGGIGLRNTRARLSQLYGADYQLELRAVEPHGAEVFIELPARRAASIEGGS